jgi:hypothetical protein
VRDLQKGRRYGDLDSLEKLIKLTYMLPNLHHGGLVICEPCDVPVSKRHLDMLYLHMNCSDKPHLGAITEQSRAQDSVDMAEIVFGREVMDQNCVIMGNVNTNSPLLVDKVVTQAIDTYCSRGQGIVVVPFYTFRRYGACQHRSFGHPSHGRGAYVLRLFATDPPGGAICLRQFSQFNEPEIRCANLWHARTDPVELCHWSNGAGCGLAAALWRIFDRKQNRRRTGGL